MGLTDIMRLNNLSGYVNSLILRKEESVGAAYFPE